MDSDFFIIYIFLVSYNLDILCLVSVASVGVGFVATSVVGFAASSPVGLLS